MNPEEGDLPEEPATGDAFVMRGAFMAVFEDKMKEKIAARARDAFMTTYDKGPHVAEFVREDFIRNVRGIFGKADMIQVKDLYDGLMAERKKDNFREIMVDQVAQDVPELWRHMQKHGPRLFPNDIHNFYLVAVEKPDGLVAQPNKVQQAANLRRIDDQNSGFLYSFNGTARLQGYTDEDFHIMPVKGLSLFYIAASEMLMENLQEQHGDYIKSIKLCTREGTNIFFRNPYNMKIGLSYPN